MTVNLNSLFFFNLSIADGYAEQFKYIDTLIRAFSHFIVQCACNASFGNELGHFLTLLYNVYATPLLEMRHFLTLRDNVYAAPLLEMSWVVRFKLYSWHLTG
ncbi:uncharacterized protein LOC131057353 isoform X3 [Cryptomeria japonica]|uniref:uncharacterized protein LOC131057353 isoform X3 n=1 Tax=Cryptomeria japonica TaxID=3369 RepID=UPI0027DA528D|nr:uncharacterized protein LOC131057353 isoform X3 [Cryptomeria japonica]